MFAEEGIRMEDELVRGRPKKYKRSKKVKTGSWGRKSRSEYIRDEINFVMGTGAGITVLIILVSWIVYRMTSG